MKRILCYGDSNTWGYIPGSGERYPEEVRWPTRLQKLLGGDYRIIEEGLNGRTTVVDDPIQPYRCGLEYLRPCLLSHMPLDLVIIMLGTNDTKRRFSLSASEIARGIEQLVSAVRESGAGPADAGTGDSPRSSPQVLILSPPLIGTYSKNDDFEGAAEKSKNFGAEFSAAAGAHGCGFLDLGRHLSAADNDGVHLTPDQHALLAELALEEIRSMQGPAA
ncbi:MAG: SGNH/GDSL hydrolase family protein [Sediminispirochaetaceae bacterium]